jgi:hypothetical protein
MEQIGLKRSFQSGGRNLTEVEYVGLHTFRKMLANRNKNLGVAGRQVLREQAERSRSFGITEFDCAAWYVLFGGNETRYENVLNSDIALIPFVKYQSAGVMDDDIIIESLIIGRSVEDAIAEFKKQHNIVQDEDFLYAETA